MTAARKPAAYPPRPASQPEPKRPPLGAYGNPVTSAKLVIGNNG